jgi:hypothetical protein|eukprot:g5587.t1
MGIWSRFNRAVVANALAFSIAFGGLKNATADYMIQTRFEDAKENGGVSMKRLVTFTTFGLFYVGGVQYIVFNRMLPRFLPGLLEGKNIKAAISAVAFDQAIHMPFMYLPSFYLFRECGLGSGTSLSSIGKNAYNEWTNGFGSDMLASMCVFIPVQGLNFFFIPPHFRVPLLTSVGFGWVMGLSYFRGKYGNADQGSAE